MSGLKFMYGDHVHTEGEVRPKTISMRAVPAPSGRHWLTEYSMNVEGQLCYDISSPPTLSELNSSIATLDSAYNEDYKDAGFLFTDNSPTAHYMTNNSSYNLSGNRVLQRSWLHQTPTEFANTRTFNITIWSQFIQSYSDLIDFQERVEYRGNGGLDFEIRDQWLGTPQYEQVAAQTHITAVQRGYTVGLFDYINPPDPLFPTREKGKLRRMVYTSPRDFGHNLRGRFALYRLDYAYYFAFETEQIAVAASRDF